MLEPTIRPHRLWVGLWAYVKVNFATGGQKLKGVLFSAHSEYIVIPVVLVSIGLLLVVSLLTPASPKEKWSPFFESLDNDCTEIMKTSELNVAGLTAAAGETTSAIQVFTIKGQDTHVPIFLINGLQDGPTLVVTAGIHGGEYPCVEAAARLGRSIDPKHLRGQMIIVPSANPIAFRARSIYITPVDGLNLNRQFPGDPNGSYTQAWADWLFRNIITAGDLYIDMHGGDMIEALVPFVSYNITGNEAVDEKAKRMAMAYGIRAVLEKRDVGGLAGTTYAAAARAGVPSLLTEAGGQGVWNEDDVSILESGVRRVMAEFGMYDGIKDVGEAPQVLGGWEWLRSEHDGLFYSSVGVGEMVREGQSVGRVADIFGTTLQQAVSPVEGEVLFLVTSLAMNAGDPLMAIAFE